MNAASTDTRPTAAPAPAPLMHHFARAFNGGAAVALAWLPAELLRAGLHGRLPWLIALLYWGLAVSVAWVIELEAWVVRRFELRPAFAAPVFALGSLLLTFPLAATLFDGAFASTLPGSESAGLWFPLLAWLMLSAALWPCIRLRHAQFAARNRVLAISAVGLGLGALALEMLNRRVMTSEYPQLHSFALCAVFIASYMGAALAYDLWSARRPEVAEPPASQTRRQRLWSWAWARGIPGVSVPVLGMGLVIASQHTLTPRAERVRLNGELRNTRWLVRSIRATVDLDQDGFSPILGAADCDDRDSRVNPAARELVDNEVDENCDGIFAVTRLGTGDASLPALHVERMDAARAFVESWRASDAVHARVASLQRPPIILLSIDALRADPLVDSPENREAFPELFALLGESRHFVHAFAPAAGTDLSMSTFMTGHIDAFAPTPLTLAEALQQGGWHTTSVVPREVLRYAGKTLLMRGFDRTTRLINDGQERDVGRHASSARATQLALADVDRYLAKHRSPEGGELSKPLALWVHYFDVHEHDELSAFDRQLRAKTRSRDPVQRYRASLQLVDTAIGELRAGLHARGLWDQALVILVSDHGESLGEHTRLPDNHGRVLYGALTHVPLAIRVPGVPGAKVDTPAGLIDLAPTILSLLDQPLPAGLDGLDLSPAIWGGEGEGAVEPPQQWGALRNRALAMYESEQRGVVAWPYKLLWRPQDGVYELYDLSQDPEEAQELSESLPQIVGEMQELLARQPVVVLDRSPSGRQDRERAAQAGTGG